MYRKLLVIIVLVTGLVMALAGTVFAQSTPMTLTLVDHNGNPLAGGVASWNDWGWHNCPGVTDANGQLVCTIPNNFNYIAMSVHGTSIAQTPAELGYTNNTWMTAEVVIELRDSNNNLITALDDNSGGRVQMYHGGYYTKGYTGTDGKFAIEIFPNNDIAKNPKFYLDYNWGTNSRTDLKIHAGTQTIVFKTAKVQLFHSGSIHIYAAGFHPFSKPSMELLPGTYDFRFSSDYNPADFVVPPAGISKLVNVLVLKDSNNANLNGGTARGGWGANFSNWHVAGPMANGVLFDIQNTVSQPGQMSYEMKFNNTTQVKTQDVSAASIFKFKTVLLTLRLETCGAAPLSGGGARYGAGNSYTTWHFPGGATNGSGETMAQVLPGGQYSFAMGYQGTEQAYPGNPVTIPGSNTTLTWQTTRVEATWPGHISYGGGSGDAAHFKTSAQTFPTPVVTAAKELMPGTIRFHFRPAGAHPGYVRDVTVGGCYHHTGYMTLIDNTGAPMTNLSFPDKPINLNWKHQCSGSWGMGKPATPVTTDAYGKIPFDMTCAAWGNLTMTLNQTSVAYPSASVLAATHYTWQAARVNVEFKDVNGAPMAGGTVAQQGSYWYTHGTTDGIGPFSFYTFPTNAGTIKVRVSYNLSAQDKTLAVLASPPAPTISTVTFQLGTVTIGSCDAPGYVQIPRGGSYGGNFSTGEVIPLLPGTYNYQGTCGSGTVTVTEGQNSVIP